jgi:hypothetical protein
MRDAAAVLCGEQEAVCWEVEVVCGELAILQDVG